MLHGGGTPDELRECAAKMALEIPVRYGEVGAAL